MKKIKKFHIRKKCKNFPECKKTYININSYNKHISTCVKKILTNNTCGYCNKQLPTLEGLKIHILFKHSKEYKCEYNNCNTLFSGPSGYELYRAHKKLIHKNGIYKIN